MRFLTGVLISIAAVLGAVEGWKFLQRTAPPDSMPAPTQGTERAVSHPVSHDTQPGTDAEQALPLSFLPAPTSEPATPLEPVPAESGHALTAFPPEEAPEEAPTEVPTEAPIDPAVASVPVPEVPLPDAPERMLMTQAAWTPFHSEYSARAFAQLMTARIERPFSVRRTTSRQFEVFFRYHTDEEREAVLREISAAAAGHQIAGAATP